ncbi:MAG: hypothetical protein IZT55_02955 [Anaerolineae bacterium]|nr:hypothetical protein [Anaerolineae bacterium]
MGKIIDTISGIALAGITNMAYKTCRIQIIGIENLQAVVNREKPIMIAAWHGMTMLLVPAIRKYLDVRSFIVIMPDDWRGRTLEVYTKWMRGEAFPMKLWGDSTLGMGRKLIELIRKIKNGKHLMLHPDGPDGPAYVAKPGLTFMAQKADGAILPVGAYCRYAYRVPRWDLYALPLPFSKITLRIGKPIIIPKGAKNLEERNHELSETLNRVTLQASADYFEQKM